MIFCSDPSSGRYSVLPDVTASITVHQISTEFGGRQLGPDLIFMRLVSLAINSH